MGESCYRYEVLNETSFPIMKNVDVAIILVMEGSQRLKKDPFLLNLVKKTIIQYNKGFKNCNKPESIIRSNNDLNHAFMTAFNYTKDLENVIVFEEDAEILNYDIKHYNIIDNYILNNNFSAISFYSDSILKYFNDYFYETYGTVFASHAVIYSKSERSKILQDILNTDFYDHFDSQHLNKILIYKEPLIVQLHPDTENFNNWKNGDKTFKKIVKLSFELSGRDKYKNSAAVYNNLRKIQCYTINNKCLLLFLILVILIAKNYLY